MGDGRGKLSSAKWKNNEFAIEEVSEGGFWSSNSDVEIPKGSGPLIKVQSSEKSRGVCLVRSRVIDRILG